MIAQVKRRRIRPGGPLPGHSDPLAMKGLEGMPESRPVRLSEHVGAHFNAEVRANTDEEVVERAMVELAHGNPIGHDRFAALAVRDNMRGIE